MTDFIDVAVIGSDPAGLTAGATLACQLHIAVNKNPQVFRSSTKSNIISGYASIQSADVAVAKIKNKNDAHSTLSDADDILAVGSSGAYPDIEGVLTLRCLFCHGYEEQRGIVSGYLGSLPIVTPALVIHLAENAAQRSEAVTLYTQVNEELAGQLQPVANSKFKFEARQIKQEKFLVHNPLTDVQGPFVAQLGIIMTSMGEIKADASAHQTSVLGAFALGDCITATSTQLHAEKYG
ncbi:FAD/NAD(P)-binding domain-containing protein [Ustulina deusta]|nr:FAD/NAD(P)-binding domain-containing protein [Ustulina deusta]